MKAKDVMTKDVISVDPEATVQEIARLLLTRRISAVPVINSQQTLVGIVSEGDLVHRPESETERRFDSWWLNAFVSADALAARFSKRVVSV